MQVLRDEWTGEFSVCFKEPASRRQVLALSPSIWHAESLEGAATDWTWTVRLRDEKQAEVIAKKEGVECCEKIMAHGVNENTD